MASKYSYALGAIGVDVDSKHFEHIRSVLKFQRNEAAKAQRDKLWNGFDVNGNGLLSLAEVDKGLRDVLQLGENLFHAKKAIMVAFHSAKTAVKLKGKHSDDYVNRCEFRLLLKYLWQYFQLYTAFMGLEEDGDLRLSKEEFVKNNDLIEKIVGVIDKPEEVWKEFKVGSNGHVLFSDFAKWGHSKLIDSGDEE